MAFCQSPLMKSRSLRDLKRSKKSGTLRAAKELLTHYSVATEHPTLTTDHQ